MDRVCDYPGSGRVVTLKPEEGNDTSASDTACSSDKVCPAARAASNASGFSAVGVAASVCPNCRLRAAYAVDCAVTPCGSLRRVRGDILIPE